jgi:lipid II:glycine glycyltransferase (peptidoglycan interpeptide bridge formation enzyme)
MEPPPQTDFSQMLMEPSNPMEFDGWDRLVLTHPSYSFYNSVGWAKVLRDTYGHRPVYFVAHRDGELKALLPVMEVNSRVTGKRGVSLPFSDNCEPLSSAEMPLQRIISAALLFGRRQRWNYFECRGGCLDGVSPSLSYYDHVLKIEQDVQSMFQRFQNRVRGPIRKAEKEGLTVEVGQGLQEVRIFYLLHAQTRKRHGLPPQPLTFFENLHKQALSRDLGIVVVTRYKQNPIAAAVFCHLGAKAIYKYSASDDAFRNLPGTNAALWGAIKWYAEKGFKELGLGRSSIANEGLRKFKAGWAAEERLIQYYRYSYHDQIYVKTKDEVFGWYNRVFGWLPLPALRLMGRVLYRHLS